MPVTRSQRRFSAHSQIFAAMEGLMERLERAVTRLEKLAATAQASGPLANGDCVNGLHDGECKSMFQCF